MRRAIRRNDSVFNASMVFAEEGPDLRHKSAPARAQAETSVDSDDDNPDPEVLAQFLDKKNDFTVPLARQREKLWQEKTRAVRRVNALLGLNGDLLTTDLQGARDDTESLKEEIQSYISMHEDSSVHQSEELYGIGQWFNLKSDEAKKDELTIDFEDFVFDTSFKDVGMLVSTMGSLRGKMSSVADKLLARTCEIVKNDESKKMLQEQQERFATEINTIMEALQRVEGHAKGLTTSNLELRENLKAVEAEKLSWQRRYMSLQAKEESIVRQMETAIKQRTEALQIHLRKGDTGALQQLMDQVRQHQLDLFATHEQLRQKDEELSKSLTEKQMLEERISGFAVEMKDLRQAAGPTANLINKLKSDIREAQMNERKMRDELRSIQQEIRAKPKVPTEIVIVNTTTMEGRPATAETESLQSLPAPPVENTVVVTAASTVEEVVSLQNDLVQLKTVIEDFREKISVKDKKIEVQSGEIMNRDELIKVYIATTATQFDKIQAKSEQLVRVLQDRSKVVDKLKIEIDTMENKLKSLKQVESWALHRNGEAERNQVDAVSQEQTGEELENELNRLISQNQRILQDFQQLFVLYNEECSKSKDLEKKIQQPVRAPTEMKETKEFLKTESNSSAAAISEICLYFCNRALHYYGEIGGDIVGADNIPISDAEATSLLSQAKDQFSGKKVFNKILDSLVEFLRQKWSGLGNLVASIRENTLRASNLAAEKANINFDQLIKASQYIDKKKLLSDCNVPKVLKTMQERYQEQKQRWEEKKAKIKAEQAACIMKCLDSFMHVVEVNFKVVLGPQTAQRTKALIYSSLLDDDARSEPHIVVPKTPSSAPAETRVVPTKVFTVPVRYLGEQDGYVSNLQSLNLDPWDHIQDQQVFCGRGAMTAREYSSRKFSSWLSATPTPRKPQTCRPERPFRDVLVPGVGVSALKIGVVNQRLELPESRQAKGQQARYAVLGQETTRPSTQHGEVPRTAGKVSRENLHVSGLLPNLL